MKIKDESRFCIMYILLKNKFNFIIYYTFPLNYPHLPWTLWVVYDRG